MHSALSLVLTLLATAVGVVLVFRRLRLPALLGYLAAGVLLGLAGDAASIGRRIDHCTRIS